MIARRSAQGRSAGSDQTPDLIIPSEVNPHVVIEAKLTQDDGAARDTVARTQSQPVAMALDEAAVRVFCRTKFRKTGS
jgi:hypothetical protein